jgi:hypothetical protein
MRAAWEQCDSRESKLKEKLDLITRHYANTRAFLGFLCEQGIIRNLDLEPWPEGIRQPKSQINLEQFNGLLMYKPKESNDG